MGAGKFENCASPSTFAEELNIAISSAPPDSYGLVCIPFPRLSAAVVGVCVLCEDAKVFTFRNGSWSVWEDSPASVDTEGLLNDLLVACAPFKSSAIRTLREAPHRHFDRDKLRESERRPG
jgi:hypothetical protein